MAKLRWYQVRLRTLGIGVTVVAIVLAIFAVYVRPYLAQTQLKESITAAGGIVETRPGPSWLQVIIGEENCQDITLVNLVDAASDQQLLIETARLPQLEVLVIGGPKFTDAGLEQLQFSGSMQALIFDSTQVTEGALADLKVRCPNIHIVTCDQQGIHAWARKGSGDEFETRDNSLPDQVAGRLGRNYRHQVIGMNRFGSVRPNAEQIATLATMHQLQQLSLERIVLSDELFAAIGQCQSLRRLTLANMRSSLKPSRLAAISEMRQLRELSFRESRVSDTDIAMLANLSQLEALDLTKTDVCDPSKWPDFPLRKLMLEETFITDSDLDAIAKYQHLQHLALNFTEVTTDGLHALAPLKDISTLELRGTRITPAAYDLLCQFPELGKVKLGSIRADIPVFFNGAQLRDWSPPFGPDFPLNEYGRVAEEIVVFQKEEYRPDPRKMQRARNNLAGELNWRSGHLRPDGMQSLHLDLLDGAVRITHLSLGGTYACDKDMRYLPSMPDLEFVDLSGTWVGDAGLRELAECKKLRAIDLCSTKVNVAGVTQLSKIKTLEHVVLPSHAIRGAEFQALTELPNLKHVQFRGTFVRSGRARLAPKLSAEDVELAVSLAKHLRNHWDADDDGKVTNIDRDLIREAHHAGQDWEYYDLDLFDHLAHAPNEGEPHEIELADVMTELLEPFRISDEARQMYPQYCTPRSLW